MSMQVQKVVNLLLVSSSAFLAGVSLSLLAPFYPDEALLKGVSVTKSGIVLSSVFVTTLVFTPLFGKYLDCILGIFSQQNLDFQVLFEDTVVLF